MDSDKIIERGDTAKYQLTIEHEDFDQQRDDFFVVFRHGMMKGCFSIKKEDMLHDEDGNWFVAFPTGGIVGWITAETHYMVQDSDMKDGSREEVERHLIGFVTDNPCPKFCAENLLKCECEEGGHVKFKRVWRSDVNSMYLILRTKDGEIKDSEGNALRVRKEEKDIY